MAQHDLTIKNSDAYQVAIKTITIHPGYICNKPKDDIAILELKDALSWSASVVPACFPVAEDHEKYSKFEDILATVTGWGWTSEDNSKGNLVLIEILINVSSIK